MRWWSMTWWLIAVNIVIFVVDLLLGGRVTEWGAFSAEAGIFRFQVWRWITYEFLQRDPWHLFFNMLPLWVFGPIVEARLGRRRYVAFYLISGLGEWLGICCFGDWGFWRRRGSRKWWGRRRAYLGCWLRRASFAGNDDTVYLAAGDADVSGGGVDLYWVGGVGDFVSWGELGWGGAHLGGAALGYLLIRNLDFFWLIRVGPRRQRFWRLGMRRVIFFGKTRKDLGELIATDGGRPPDVHPGL